VIAVEAAEIADHPEGTDPNALYAVQAGGLWFLHMGDLGFGLRNDELRAFVGRCDVLLALVGEGLTLPLGELDPMIEFLEPKWVVPMHYSLPPISAGMAGVDSFLQRHPRWPVLVARHHTVTFPLPVSPLGYPTIVVLEPSGYTATGGFPEFCCR
jgi:L-ascorbate metabolism protein UlaG (beta-lactamase superfamily)